MLRGIQPSHGDGEVRVRLSPDSAQVLDKVATLKKWSVAPPMTRGSKAAAASLPNEKEDTVDHLPPKKEKKSKKSKKALKMHVKKPKLSAPKPVKDAVNVDGLDESSIRRTPQGREAVKLIMNSLLKLDEKSFGSAPVFSPEGKCRMKFEGAELVSWQDLLDSSPMAFETLRLD